MRSPGSPRGGSRLRRVLWRMVTTPVRLFDRHVRERVVAGRVRHVSGPASVSYAADELAAICIVRNGEQYVRTFIEHHLQLGIAHIVILDNGSVDRTTEIAREYDEVTVLTTDLPYSRYENAMKRYLARRFSAGRWNLCVDIDELFDYPFSKAVPLSSFLRYLDGRGFTAVLAHMLDLFGAGPAAASDGDHRHHCRYYDVTAVERTSYHWSRVASPEIRMHWGGIRRQLFGTRNGLTKAALVRVSDDVELFVDWHQVRGAVVADVTAVLLHYPFTAGFREKVEDAVRTGRYGFRTTGEYRRYRAALDAAPELRIWSDDARELRSIEQLLDEGFLTASAEFRALAARGAR